MKKILLILVLFINVYSIEIKQMPLEFTQKRVDLTKQYIKNSYGLEVDNINIIPKIIVTQLSHIDSNKFMN